MIGKSRAMTLEFTGASGGMDFISPEAMPKASPVTGAINPSSAAFFKAACPSSLQMSTQPAVLPIASDRGRHEMVKLPRLEDSVKWTNGPAANPSASRGTDAHAAMEPAQMTTSPLANPFGFMGLRAPESGRAVSRRRQGYDPSPVLQFREAVWV